MQTVLLTGFEPFDQDLINPSWEASRQLDAVRLSEDVHIVARRLPCAFATAGACLTRLIAEFDPVMVIATGLAPGRGDFSMERVAINVNDARIPDNLGAQPVDTPVVSEGRPPISRPCRSKRWSRLCARPGSRRRFHRRRGPLCVIRCFTCCSMP